MCTNIKTIAIGSNGELSICTNCNIYHLEFNNVYLEFTVAQYQQFKKYLFALEADYWENKYEAAHIKRKIPIPSQQSNLVLMFNRQEIAELKALFSNKKHVYNSYLSLEDIDYTLLLN